MITKRNLLAAGVMVVLTSGVLFTVGQKILPKPQVDSNSNRWSRFWHGPNGHHRTQSSETQPIQLDQVSQSGTPAEIIGRTGYPLYR